MPYKDQNIPHPSLYCPITFVTLKYQRCRDINDVKILKTLKSPNIFLATASDDKLKLEDNR